MGKKCGVFVGVAGLLAICASGALAQCRGGARSGTATGSAATASATALRTFGAVSSASGMGYSPYASMLAPQRMQQAYVQQVMMQQAYAQAVTQQAAAQQEYVDGRAQKKLAARERRRAANELKAELAKAKKANAAKAAVDAAKSLAGN